MTASTGGDLFFSERDAGSRPPVGDEIDEVVWGGIVALILRRVADGSFAMDYPTPCEDAGRGVTATSEEQFWPALRASVPDLPWPIRPRDLPAASAAMDVVEFAARHIARASEGGYHSGLRHAHLEFDREGGLADLQRDADEILRRSGLAFAMDATGRVKRLAPPVVRDRIQSPLPTTGRPSLDRRLARSIEKYKSPDPIEREEALEKLWDAWDELKTLQAKKPEGIETLIAQVADHPRYRQELNDDGLATTKIGNAFQIRHTETDKIPLESSSQVDYFFGRLFNLIWLFLSAQVSDGQLDDDA
jgi:hypothetical protein